MIIVSFCSEVAGWSDELLVRPKAKAKGKAIASPAGSSAGGMGWIAWAGKPSVFIGWTALCFSWAG